MAARPKDANDNLCGPAAMWVFTPPNQPNMSLPRSTEATNCLCEDPDCGKNQAPVVEYCVSGIFDSPLFWGAWPSNCYMSKTG